MILSSEKVFLHKKTGKNSAPKQQNGRADETNISSKTFRLDSKSHQYSTRETDATSGEV